MIPHLVIFCCIISECNLKFVSAQIKELIFSENIAILSILLREQRYFHRFLMDGRESREHKSNRIQPGERFSGEAADLKTFLDLARKFKYPNFIDHIQSEKWPDIIICPLDFENKSTLTCIYVSGWSICKTVFGGCFWNSSIILTR